MRRPSQRGVSLIEIVIGMAIGSMLMAMGASSFSGWIQNSRIRTAAESIRNGLQLARGAAVQRNISVRFQLTTSTGNDCAVSTALSNSGTNWVVSQENPAGQCANSDPNAAPHIVQVRGSGETSAKPRVWMDRACIAFTGTGQTLDCQNPAAARPSMSVDVRTADGFAACAPGGAVRCLRITVSANGQIRMCDPALASPDPGAC